MLRDLAISLISLIQFIIGQAILYAGSCWEAQCVCVCMWGGGGGGDAAGAVAGGGRGLSFSWLNVLTRISAPSSWLNRQPGGESQPCVKQQQQQEQQQSGGLGREKEWERTEPWHLHHAADHHQPSILYDYMSRWAPVCLYLTEGQQRCVVPAMTT